jgi:hypothetical protein
MITRYNFLASRVARAQCHDAPNANTVSLERIAPREAPKQHITTLATFTILAITTLHLSLPFLKKSPTNEF